MIKAILHLFKIHRKVIFGNPPIVVQNMFSETPKTLNAVNVILGALVNQILFIRHGMMLPQTLQGIVTSELVGVVDRALSRFLPNNRHQFFFGHMLHHSRIYLSIALQKAKNNVFTGCTPSALALAPSTEVAFIHFHFAVQFASFKLCRMIDCFSESLIDACYCFVVHAPIIRKTVCRLLLIKPLYDCNFCFDALQGFLFSTARVPTPDISTTRPRYLERTAENTLLSPQKVGRTVKTIVSTSNHMGILVPAGYF